MNKPSTLTSANEFTGRHMAVILTTFFAVVVLVNLSMAVLAKRSWTGLVVPNSYVASQQFNDVTAKLEASAALNIRSRLSVSNGKIQLSLDSASGSALEVREAVISLSKASSSGDRQNLLLTCDQQGLCTAAAKLEKGLWIGEVSAQVPGKGDWTKPVELWIDEVSP